ncbi:phospholipase D-like domain-containing protein [Roseobacter ponti]|uniref:phospholipase D-like domain-containing protein n=1 Tax=Roseobacter ponti TaxID=1891787 RepID=UPI001980F89C|nr:phospholipase D family protein [Roseobacter ponti]
MLYPLISAILVSCTALQPIFLPPEYTEAPVNEGVWREIGSGNGRDWQVPLNDGPSALSWRLRAIDSAEASIDLQTFLWTLDTVGTKVLSRLLAAAHRGVQVKLLIDDSFLAGEDQTLLALEQHENIEYRIYNPYKRRSGAAITRTIFNLGEFHRLDHRMHNKAMIVDNQIAIVGGRNIADEYFGLDDSANFRDMDLLIGGPAVRKITASFDEYWNDQWSFPVHEISHVRTREISHDGLLPDPDTTHRYHDGLSDAGTADIWRRTVRGAFRGSVELYVDRPPVGNPDDAANAPVQVADELALLFENARREIIIVSAYLIPTQRVSDALAAAVKRGVRVRILTNSIRSNNHLVAHSAYQNHVREMLSAGVDLHEVRAEAKERHRYIVSPVAQKKLGLHAKYLIIDSDLVFIGSANLDPRSLRINTEIGLLVRDRALNRELRELTNPDFLRSNAWELDITPDQKVVWIGDDITLDAQPASSVFQRIGDWFFAHLPIEGEL